MTKKTKKKKDWKEVKLGELCGFQTGKLNSNAALDNGVYPFFTCSKEIYKTNTCSFNTESVLLGGNNANGIFPIFYFKGKFDAYQRTYVIEPKDKTKINIRFLYYLLKTHLKKFQFLSTGVTTKFLTIEILNNYKLKIPTLKKQKRIASILSAYDDLIEINNRRIEILEEIAETIYKEYFVHFHYPCLPSDYSSGAGKPNLPSDYSSGAGKPNLPLDESFGVGKPVTEKSTQISSYCTYDKVGGLPIPKEGKWYIYVILCEDESFYIGMTNDLYRRWYEHTSGKGAQWTKSHKPVKVIHYEEFNSKNTAAKREKELKTGFGRKWLKREYKKLLDNEKDLPTHKSKIKISKLMPAGQMVDSELGKIPEGWRVRKLKELGNLTMGTSPKGNYYNTEEVGYPLLNGPSDLREKEIKPNKYTTKTIRNCNKEDLLFCIRGTIGNINFSDKIYSIGRGVSAFTICDNFYKEYLYFYLKKEFIKLKNIATGSVIKGLTKQDIENIYILQPDFKIIKSFQNVVKKILIYVNISKDIKKRLKIQMKLFIKELL
ncbi:restriction endonuclease subunit S [Candidatus Dependentiae bacterium]|nr:restriction endonuclease subunit S [Candidatus Dependentiae bacterium]